MRSEGKIFWIGYILLTASIGSCYLLLSMVQDGSVGWGEGVGQVRQAPSPDQGGEERATENKLDLYSLPLEELLEIQVASVI